MRMFVLKEEQDLQALATRLGGAGGVASIERLKALNPHLDLGRIQPGTVLLVPDDVDDADSVAGAVFTGLATEVKEGLRNATARVRSGHAKAEVLRKDVAASFKSAAFKKALEGDAELRKQMASADARFKTDQARTKQNDQALVELEKLIGEDLTALGKLVR